MRYVFPDGEPLSFSRVQLALERAGFRIDHIEGFREDYADPEEWTQRLDEHLERAEQLAGEDRTRIWRLYLRAARHGFDTGSPPSIRSALAGPIERVQVAVTVGDWPSGAPPPSSACTANGAGRGAAKRALKAARGRAAPRA